MDRKTNEDVDKATLDGKAGGTAVGGSIGAVVGGLVGGPVGAGIGAVAGASLGGAAGATFDDRDYQAVEPEFRDLWERGPYKASTSWDAASSAYQYGWDSHSRSEYQGRSWEEVSPQLASGWSGHGTWDDWEPLARSAWEKRRDGGAPAKM
ncbi:MAG: hypothetical protein NVSMB9_05280 [Isosphaeraceae bacterium]